MIERYSLVEIGCDPNLKPWLGAEAPVEDGWMLEVCPSGVL